MNILDRLWIKKQVGSVGNIGESFREGGGQVVPITKDGGRLDMCCPFNDLRDCQEDLCMAWQWSLEINRETGAIEQSQASGFCSLI